MLGRGVHGRISGLDARGSENIACAYLQSQLTADLPRSQTRCRKSLGLSFTRSSLAGPTRIQSELTKQGKERNSTARPTVQA